MRITDDTLKYVSDTLADRMEEVTLYMLRKLAKRLKATGELGSSHAIYAMADVGADIAEITAYLAAATGKNIAEVQLAMQKIAKGAYSDTAAYFKATGRTQVPFKDNVKLQNIIKAQGKLTAQTYQNISRTTVVRLTDGGTPTPLGTAYRKAIDEAATALNAGISNYDDLIARTLNQFADSGICSVEYESGLTRDIYSATRLNTLEGCRQVNMQIREELGEEFGADGVEITTHGMCAPDHLKIQGRQFAAGWSDVTVDGKKYKSYEKMNASLDRQIGTCNCQHSTYPIVLGVNAPNHTSAQLKRIEQTNEAKSVTIDGKDYTKYEASQIMRKLETAMRKEKRKIAAFSAAGDPQRERAAKSRLRQLQQKYRQVSKDSGIAKDYTRTRV